MPQNFGWWLKLGVILWMRQCSFIASFTWLKPHEISKIVNAFIDSSEIAQSGLYMGGAKYMVIQGEPGAVIRGKKGSGGVTIKKTTSALVFGTYDEPVTPGECTVIVEGLGDYLINAGI